MYLHQYAITGFAVSSCDARTMNLVKSADFNLAGTCAAIVLDCDERRGRENEAIPNDIIQRRGCLIWYDARVQEADYLW